MLNRGRNIEKGRVITRRMFILAAAKILLFAGISSRLYNLQISDREKYEILSDKNRIREWKTPPQRGIIVDNFNKVLASNDRVFQLHLILDEINDFDVTIYRDRFGVPHIIGKKDKDTAYGLAYAHAEDDFETIQDMMLFARGKLASKKGKKNGLEWLPIATPKGLGSCKC